MPETNDEEKDSQLAVDGRRVILSDIPIQRSPDFRSLYVNNTKFGVTPFEFAFIMGEISEAVDGKPYVDQKIRLLMTPLHAKIFMLILAQNMHNYEQQFGEVVIPPPFLEGIPPAESGMASDPTEKK